MCKVFDHQYSISDFEVIKKEDFFQRVIIAGIARHLRL